MVAKSMHHAITDTEQKLIRSMPFWAKRIFRFYLKMHILMISEDGDNRYAPLQMQVKPVPVYERWCSKGNICASLTVSSTIHH